MAEHGRLDVLVNNAFDDGDRTPFLDADLDRSRAGGFTAHIEDVGPVGQELASLIDGGLNAVTFGENAIPRK